MSRTRYQKQKGRIGSGNKPTRGTQDGVALLSKAANEHIAQNSTALVECLAELAMGGNASCARLLIELAEGAAWIENPETVDRLLRVAEGWERELERSGDVVETPCGGVASLEPEI